MNLRIRLSLFFALVLLVITIITSLVFMKTDKVNSILIKDHDKSFIMVEKKLVEENLKPHERFSIYDENNREFNVQVDHFEEIEGVDYVKMFLNSSEEITGNVHFYFENESWGKYILHKVI